MKITLIIGEAAKANPGDSRIGRLAGALSKPSALAVGAGIILQRAELTAPMLQGKLDPLLAQTASWDLELTATAMLVSYAGGAYLMSLKEKIMKPLMDAQYEKGLDRNWQQAGNRHGHRRVRSVEGAPRGRGRSLRPRPGGRDGRRLSEVGAPPPTGIKRGPAATAGPFQFQGIPQIPTHPGRKIARNGLSGPRSGDFHPRQVSQDHERPENGHRRQRGRIASGGEKAPTPKKRRRRMTKYTWITFAPPFRDKYLVSRNHTTVEGAAKAMHAYCPSPTARQCPPPARISWHWKSPRRYAP